VSHECPAGRRKDDIDLRLEFPITDTFGGQVLPFDAESSIPYAAVTHHAARGRPIALQDPQMASIGLQHNAALATRDVADFEGTGITVINPWPD